jgi:hypothetical protein
MTTPDPENLLRHALRGDSGSVTPECLDDETVAALAEGTIDADSRAAAMLHLATCARCRLAVASVVRALADPAVAREVPTAARGHRRLLQVAIPAAAAAVILLLAMPSRQDDGAPPHRAPTITAVSSPIPMSPVGIVAAAETLRWATVAGADRYRVTLFDAVGGVVYESQTADSVVALPDSVRLTRGRSYLWKVEARTGWGRWSASELIEFSVR